MPTERGLTLYLSPQGDDGSTGRTPSPGSPDGPFASMERAREEIRGLRRGPGLPRGGVVVDIAGGVYEMKAPFRLTEEDSGTEAAGVQYRGNPGLTRFSGGRVVDGFEPVTDSRILGRLAEEARPHVVHANLRDLGITDFGSPGGGGMEVFHDDQPMTLARWPKDGFVGITGLAGNDPVDVRGTRGDHTGAFLYDEERIDRWAKEPEAWVHGYWFWDWADQRHRIASINVPGRIITVQKPFHGYGYRVGQYFYGFNLLCELDSPGEWYVDRDAGILYFWPPESEGEGRTVVSVTDSLIELDGASHITLSGITFEACRSTAMTVHGGRDVRVAGCAVRNSGGWGIRVEGGTDHAVVSCDLRDLGGGGVDMSGGRRPELERAGHVVENNHIHRYGRWDRMGRPGVSIKGVGISVRHNLIHDAPHMGVQFAGNDHTIELNEIHHVCTESNDAGAVYAGRDWTMRGTVIRHNYLHHITGYEDRACVGVYLDDMYCGTMIEGNIFHRVCRPAFIGGGRDCVVRNNIFHSCHPALHIDARAMNWASYHVATTMTEKLKEMPYTNPLWSKRYPELVGILDDDPAAPKGNRIEKNISIDSTWDDVFPDARPYVELDDNLVDEDPGFSGTPPESFALDPQGLAVRAGFEPIPEDRIGLYEDEWRTAP